MLIETRIALLDEKHLVEKTIKFSLALFRMRNWLSLRGGGGGAPQRNPIPHSKSGNKHLERKPINSEF